MNTRFWLSVTVLMSWIGICEAAGQCHTAEYSIGRMFLKGHTFKTCQVGLPEECYFRCDEEVTCQSYNYFISQRICELNNRTKEARPEDFMPDPNRFYLKRLTNRAILGSIKELPAESCSEIKASEGNEMVNGDYWIYSDGNSQTILARCEENWQMINREPICFGTRDDQYGAFDIPKSGRIKTMKLVHKSGSIECNPTYGASYWGCINPGSYGNGKLMTIITNANKESVLPPVGDLKALPGERCVAKKHFYSLEGTSLTSPELVFRDLSNPLSVLRNQELQIWYGQDWIDCSEEGNQGNTCVDVFVWYA